MPNTHGGALPIGFGAKLATFGPTSVNLGPVEIGQIGANFVQIWQIFTQIHQSRPWFGEFGQMWAAFGQSCAQIHTSAPHSANFGCVRHPARKDDGPGRWLYLDCIAPSVPLYFVCPFSCHRGVPRNAVYATVYVVAGRRRNTPHCGVFRPASRICRMWQQTAGPAWKCARKLGFPSLWERSCKQVFGWADHLARIQPDREAASIMRWRVFKRWRTCQHLGAAGGDMATPLCGVVRKMRWRSS